MIRELYGPAPIPPPITANLMIFELTFLAPYQEYLQHKYFALYRMSIETVTQRSWMWRSWVHDGMRQIQYQAPSSLQPASLINARMDLASHQMLQFLVALHCALWSSS